jgi:inhibitor of cysteine peptidase
MSMNTSAVRAAVRPVIQQLEGRTLLSGNNAWETWVIRGDASRRHPNDLIIVDVDPADATRARARVNGQVVGTHALAGLKTIQVGAGRGDDVVSVELGKNSGVIVHVWGGFGNDQLQGDGGQQAFYGGPGADRIDAAGGNDTLVGNDGNDDLTAGDGDDWACGNAGNDTVAGNDGMDRLFGEKGSDQIDGGDGRDKIEGGKGFDTVKGGGGRDALSGDNERDWVYLTQDYDTTDNDPTDRLRGDTSMLPLQRTTLDELRARFRQMALDQWSDGFGEEIDLTAPYGYWGGWGTVNDVVSFGAPSVSAPIRLASTSSFSGTNTQVTGVDEADLVETDGEFLYSISGADVVITDAATLKVVARRAFSGQAVGLYLLGDRLTVISEQSTYVEKALPAGMTRPEGSPAPSATTTRLAVAPWWGSRIPGSYEQTVTLTVLDVSDASAPKVAEETKLDGNYVSSRAIGDRVYAVVQNSFRAPIPDLVKVDDHTVKYESRESYLAHLDGGWLDEALPGYVGTAADGSTSSGLLVGGGYDYTKDGWADVMNQPMLSVALLNVADGKSDALASTSVAGWGGQVYASADALYLAQPNVVGGSEKSDLYKFGLGADAVPLLAAGRVEGRVLNQFSMDEDGEYFRLATTEGWATSASNNVFVLDQVGDELRTVGSVEGIAEGESVFATRFMGDRAYVITFERTDPLWTLDLSNPTAPKIAGELVIPGFSTYLHPIDETHLIGIGRSDNGVAAGVQVSLFDVSDIANPKRLHVFDVTDTGTYASSLAATDHHAFSYFPETGVLAFPVREDRSAAGSAEVRMEVLRVSPRTGFTRLGEIEQDGDILRAVRIGDQIFSVGDRVIKAVDGEDPDTVIGEVVIGTGTTPAIPGSNPFQPVLFRTLAVN